LRYKSGIITVNKDYTTNERIIGKKHKIFGISSANAIIH